MQQQPANMVRHPALCEASPVIAEELKRYLDAAGRVVNWPAKRATRQHVYAYLAAFFEPGQSYREKEVDQILRRYLACHDYMTVRRDLCDFHYLQRERDGSRYWRRLENADEQKEQR